MPCGGQGPEAVIGSQSAVPMSDYSGRGGDNGHMFEGVYFFGDGVHCTVNDYSFGKSLRV